ncbi:putative peroxidase-related enzyme [Angulomicrobium tetraedrale]|uniref:Putative peroxidase-related enzyme n=1 Tax=Ancylobacter tetraedralis TaxID=217068 RepID=A0A839YZU3_9HYPH|nr:peroxidase-related enzyme [Ancylobacter tetraedralis]MBB3770034.1 putative peroxidase-related enzyme [Ancylobacter tetraedralis]
MANVAKKAETAPTAHVEGLVSWLDLPAPTATPETDALFADSLEKRGYIRNTQYVLAQIPALLLAQDALSRSLTVDFDSGLSGKERELIALVVSVDNRCEPCVFGHAAKLRQITGDPLWVGKLEVNYRRADLTPRERAIADYAVKISRAPAEIEPSDIEGLRSVGLSEREILEAAGIAAYFNFSNRVNSALGIHPNPEPFVSFR